MDILWNSAFFIIALGVLVTIHEYGHFWVARKLGVKVLVFSFGFGKPLLQKVGKDGVRYYLSTFPLGGYVKMLDERDEENPVSEDEKHLAFNRQSVWARMAIVLAGPLANFVLAIFLYSAMYMIGVRDLSTEIGSVPENSIAQQAGLKKGDLIKQVDGQPVTVLHDVTKSLAKRMGERGVIKLVVWSKDNHSNREVVLDIQNWTLNDKKPELLHSLGIFHPLEQGGTEIGSIVSGKPADMSGMRVGDIVKSVAGQKVVSWREMGALIASSANKAISIEVERNGELIDISVVIESTGKNEPNSGRIGVGSVVPDFSLYTVNQRFGLFESISLGYSEMLNMVELSARLVAKLIKGQVSLKSLSGPVSIAKGAGQTASIGLAYFIGFLAMISVNLGFINLLPVPMLDGGHFLYFIIEAIKGSPLPEKIQELGLQVGMMMVFALMAIAIFNDFA